MLTKAPLKSDDIINYYTRANKVMKEEFRRTGKKFPSLEERIFRAPQSFNTGFFVKSWNIFLGHIKTNLETIRVTLKRADDVGLIKFFDSCYVNKATRIYDFMAPTEEELENIWSSVNGMTKNSYNELWPSYTYPPALLRHFGRADIVDDFFVLIGDTFLSQKHLFKKDWNWFLSNVLDPNTFLSWWTSAIKSEYSLQSFTEIPEVLKFLVFLQNNPSIDNIKLLFNPPSGRKRLINYATNIAIQYILFSLDKETLSIMQRISLPPLKITLDLSPYKFAVKIFKNYSNKDDLFSDVNSNTVNSGLPRFLVDYLLYLMNTPLSEEYRIFFVNEDPVS